MPSPSPTKKLRIFLSHAVDDKPKVRKICQRLKNDGFDPWLDEEQILPGHSREFEIERALRSCDLILLCFSMNSVSKEGYIQREYQQAMDIQREKPEGTIFVIPLRLDKCDMPHFISALQWVDYPANYARLLQSLRIRGVSNMPPVPVESSNLRKQKKRGDSSLSTKRANSSPGGDFTFRQGILDKFFLFVSHSESFYMVGAVGMGKTRLLDFLMRYDVQRHYLGEKADEYWLVRVDWNRLAVRNETWAFYELLLSSILFAVTYHPNVESLRTEIARIELDVIQQRDDVLALRLFELVVDKLCQGYGIKLSFLFDEFDEVYTTLAREVFRQLRAVRDSNKHHVSFVLFLRQLPELLRNPSDNESFYELLSRNAIGLDTYSRTDALRILEQIEARRRITLSGDQREGLLEASGGHIGLIQGLLSAFVESTPALPAIAQPGWIQVWGRQPVVVEECRKIFEGLSEAEQAGLCAFGRGDYASITPAIEKSLLLKGMLRRDNSAVSFFCEIFEQYVKRLRS